MVESGSQQVVAGLKRYQYPLIGGLVQLLVRLRVHPNLLTVLAFVAGLVSLTYLFVRWDLFVLFAIIHLLLDVLDGSVARATKTSEFGGYLDYVSDRSIEFGLFAKTYVVFGDPLVLVALGIFLLHHLLYVVSKRRLPVVYVRTTLLVIFALGFYEVGYVSVAGVLGYGVFQQVGSFAAKSAKN